MRHRTLISALVVSVVIAIAMAATSSVSGQSAPLEKTRAVAKAVSTNKTYTAPKTFAKQAAARPPTNRLPFQAGNRSAS